MTVFAAVFSAAGTPQVRFLSSVSTAFVATLWSRPTAWSTTAPSARRNSRLNPGWAIHR